MQHYGAAEYHRAGGAYDAALSEFEAALSLTAAGDHQFWAYLAGAHLRALDELGSAAEAVRLGQKYLRAAETVRLGYVTSYILMPMAVAPAKLGDADAAARSVERAAAHFAELGSTGLNPGSSTRRAPGSRSRQREGGIRPSDGALPESLHHERQPRRW